MQFCAYSKASWSKRYSVRGHILPAWHVGNFTTLREAEITFYESILYAGVNCRSLVNEELLPTECKEPPDGLLYSSTVVNSESGSVVVLEASVEGYLAKLRELDRCYQLRKSFSPKDLPPLSEKDRQTIKNLEMYRGLQTRVGLSYQLDPEILAMRKERYGYDAVQVNPQQPRLVTAKEKGNQAEKERERETMEKVAVKGKEREETVEREQRTETEKDLWREILRDAKENIDPQWAREPWVMEVGKGPQAGAKQFPRLARGAKSPEAVSIGETKAGGHQRSESMGVGRGRRAYPGGTGERRRNASASGRIY
ncbi:hypothetical protein IAT38_003758 [Cryptococcus sp. DSM 104549]